MSQDLKHDQVFVECAQHEMLIGTEIEPRTTIILENDNCSLQYKSSPHFESIQKISDKYNVNILPVFGTPEHGKGEVDHVGGVAKSTIRWEIAGGGFFADAYGMVLMFERKFRDQ